jgi:hypothetical protein
MVRTNISEADILNEGRVQVAALPDLLQQGVDHVLEAGVLEAALLGLGQGRSDGEGDYDIVGVLGLAAEQTVSATSHVKVKDGATYMELSDDPGARWRKSEPMRSAAIVTRIKRG